MNRASLTETRREYIHVGSTAASSRQLLLRCYTSCIHAVVRLTVSVKDEQSLSLELTGQQ